VAGLAAGDRGASAALVCFSGRTDVPWLRLLRPGFRHCFCLLRGEAGWLLIDPRCDRLDIRLLPDAPASRLIGRFRAAGCRVVPLPGVPLPGAAPAGAPARALAMLPAPHSCVETVKRALGLAAPWAVTPYGLYRHLKKKYLVKKNLLTFCSKARIPTSERARRASARRGRAPAP
jgi:hypothetical protein